MIADNPVIGTIVLDADNDIVWFQDFRWSRGLPDGIQFDIREEPARYYLTAPGYGYPHPGYGRGGFFVPVDGFPVHRIVRAVKNWT